MAIQVVFSPPPGTTVPIAFADGSGLPPDASVVRNAPRCRQAELGGKQMANRAPSTTKKNIPSTTRKFLAAGCLALGVNDRGLFASGGTAAADGLEVTPPRPAVDRRGRLQNYDTSIYPADSYWPGPPAWGPHPADPSWPGISSHPCCSG